MTKIIVKHNQADSQSQANANLPVRAIGLIKNMLLTSLFNRNKLVVKMNDGSIETFTPDSGLVSQDASVNLGFKYSAAIPKTNVQEAVEYLNSKVDSAVNNVSTSDRGGIYYIASFEDFRFALEDPLYLEKHLIFTSNLILPYSETTESSYLGSVSGYNFFEAVFEFDIPVGVSVTMSSKVSFYAYSQTGHYSTPNSLNIIMDHTYLTAIYSSGINITRKLTIRNTTGNTNVFSKQCFSDMSINLIGFGTNTSPTTGGSGNSDYWCQFDFIIGNSSILNFYRLDHAANHPTRPQFRVSSNVRVYNIDTVSGADGLTENDDSIFQALTYDIATPMTLCLDILRPYLKNNAGGGGDYIAKDGTTDTTAPIPFAEGLIITGSIQDGQEGSIRLQDGGWISATTNTGVVSLIGGLDATNARFTVTPTQASVGGSGLLIGQTNLDGSSIKIPDGSWICPQTEQGGMYLTNGENPSTLNSVLHLTSGSTVLTNGDGTDQFGQISIDSGSVSLYHNEDGSSNSSVSLYNNYVTLYSGANSNVVLSSNSATMYGGDSNLTLNDTYASLYQAGSGFYIDSTGIKPQGISSGIVTTNSFVGLNSAGYLVKSPALSTTTAGVLTRIYFNPLDVVVDGTTYNTLTSDGPGTFDETQSVSSNNTLQTFATSFISDSYLTDGVIRAGGYTANMWVNTNNCNHEVDYYIYEYLTDALGANPLLLGILASGGLVLSDSNDHIIQLTTAIPADVPYVAGQRIKFVVKAIAHAVGGGAHTLSIKYGLTHQSYIDIPVDITTDMVTDTRNGQILTASLDNLIAKDGSIITTAPIPFAQGLSVASVFEVTNNGTINSQSPINVRTTIGDDLCLQLDHVGGEGYLITKNTTLDLNGLYFRFYGDLDLDFGTLVTDPKFNINTKVKLPNIATGSVISGGFVGLDTNNILVKSGIAYSDISGVPSLENYQLLSEKNAVSGYAGLDVSGKINPSQLPALAITDTFVVASQSAMLALSTAEVGDIAVRTDINKTFILKTTGYATLANWQELLSPTDLVSSVFGRSGAVTAQANDYTFAQIGSKPTTLVGYGITDAQPLDSDLTTIAGLSADGLLRKTSGTWGMDSVVYVTQTALDLKANIASPTFTGTVSGITSAMVGLGNVNNTSDADKPVSTATQTALNLKATIASPTFTGDPKAPTPALGDNDTSVATTAFVRSAINSVTSVASTATLTVNSLTTTQANITAQAVALTIASPTGGVDGRKLIIRIKDDGTARSITWNAIFRAIGVTLPSTTVASKVLYVGAIYNSTETKWDVVSVAQQA